VTRRPSLRGDTASAAIDRGAPFRVSTIFLVGTMRASGPAGENILPHARKARALLAYLCCAPGDRVPRSTLAGLLWDTSTEADARSNLRHAMAELNSLVQGAAPDLLESDRQFLRLNVSACWIDILADPPNHDETLLVEFDGINSLFDDWLAGERTRCANRWRTRLEQELGDLVDRKAAPDARLAAARRLVSFDPTHEGGIQNLMTALIDLGDRAQAIREFERGREALRTHLDIFPSPKTVALYEAARVMASSPSVFRHRREPERIICINETAAAEPIGETDGAGDRLKAQGAQPSIAVLPFADLFPEPGRERAADGLVEDLTEALSRVPGFFVISRLSASAFRTQGRSPEEIGKALGVRYVLSGSMRLTGSRLRLVVELTDAAAGIPLWRSNLDEKFSDLLDVQVQLADEIIGRIAPYLRSAELKRIRTKRPERLDAYELFFQAQQNIYNSSRAVFESCEGLFDEAIRRSPHYAAALAWRAYWHVLRVGQGWSPDPEHDARLADQFARRAVECDPLEPMALSVNGHVASYLHKDFELAFRQFDSALRINPNAAPAWLWSAVANAWLGEGPRAIEEINRAMALSPYDPLMYTYSAVAGVAYLADGQYERAVECALRCMSENRTYTAAYKLHAVALVLGGREREAQTPVHQLLMLEPEFTVDQFRRRYPGSGTPSGELYCEALARAGAPVSALTDAAPRPVRSLAFR
jgi:TolB-like protein/DNA-binding SARP family transcriptional activator